MARCAGHTVHFKDGGATDYDLGLGATGYKLHYPFIDHSLLNWQGMAPHLYLNILSPRFDNLAVMGMIEASGIGWQGRYEQAELMARFFKAQAEGSPRADALRQAKTGPQPDLSGGFKVLRVEIIEAIRLTAYEIEHIKTGAKVLHLHAFDRENL